jgi:signal transduction histidine kinase
MTMTTLALLLGTCAIVATITAGWTWLRGRACRAALAACEARLRVVAAEVREQAASQERERIYADLHDDLGAKLLGLIYQAESPVQADLARAILQDLRDVVTRSRGTPGSLGDVLADIRAEATQRLAAVGIGLAWEAPDDLPDPLLDSGRALHLHRIVREALSNTIRHAQARQVRVRVRAAHGELLLDVTDDGSGVAAVIRAGAGMRGMQDRADALDGRIDWVAGTAGGAKVLLRVPLEDAR